MAKRLFITNERMLLLMQWAVRERVCENETEYLTSIGFPRTNLNNVKQGKLSFTKDHILKACELTGASADYVFGFTNIRTRKTGKESIQLLKEALTAVELELKRK